LVDHFVHEMQASRGSISAKIISDGLPSGSLLRASSGELDVTVNLGAVLRVNRAELALAMAVSRSEDCGAHPQGAAWATTKPMT
jgi:hypothetical protein